MHKFDQIVLGAMDVAYAEALKRKNTEVTPYHLLYGLINTPQSFSSKALKEQKKNIENELKKFAISTQKISIEELRPSTQFSEWITLASSHAIQRNVHEIGEQDLIRYMPQVFPKLDIDYQKFKESFSEHQEETETPSFLIDLNDLARNGKLDPVIGRTKEIRSVIEILGRRNKNNPILVGSAGVGKTAIVEGLADAIEKGDVPDVLKGRTVYSLNLGSLMAGTKFRGEFEERIQALLKFIKEKNGEAILFIDEIHQLVGAGKTEGAMDAANLLKPALARGELHCIGATTDDEFQKYILNDSALERRFRAIPVIEPSVEDAVQILMGVREKLEIHHGIKISDEAIYAAVTLSEQYVTNKFLPDKAIDLVDESSSALKLSAEAMPSSLAELEALIRSKKIFATVHKDVELNKEIELLESKFLEEKAKWEKEVFNLKNISALKNELERLKFDLEQSERKQNYEEASKIKYSLIPEVEKKLAGVSHDWVLAPKDIAQVISRQTQIPVEKILKSKQDNLLELEAVLNKSVFGQEEALKELANTLLISHAGLSAQNRPLGSFLLKGPSGVGKTETAKALTRFLFNSEKNLIRLDMSEFSEKHSVAKLIGSPAGYVGYDDGGVLTEAVRIHPYSVILFDEIEKAHHDFADILLQMLDDARLTDNKGRTISFKNCVIMMTTNSTNIEFDFRPEVLGRIDAILTYKSIDKKMMKSLIQKELADLNEKLKTKKASVELDEACVHYLSEHGYNESYGARPLRSLFNKVVARPLAKLILQGDFREGKICFTIKDGEAVTIQRQ